MKPVSTGRALRALAAALLLPCLMPPAQAQTAATSALEQRAAQGDAKAMAALGHALRKGQGVPQDPARAFELLSKAAEAGEASAMNDLGWMYWEGEGRPKDEAQSFAWYLRAARAGHEDAFVQAAWFYSAGRGVEANGIEAVKWYRRAAEAQQPVAMYNLGIVYGKGLPGLPANKDQAHFWMVRAMVAGHEGAKQRLMQAGYRTPLDVMAAFNTIVSQMGGRVRVANYKDDGINGGTFTLYRTASGGAGGNVVWMMDFGVKPSPELRTVIGAAVRKTDMPGGRDAAEWRQRLLVELKLQALDPDLMRFEGELAP
jgi:TPR repeat protein